MTHSDVIYQQQRRIEAEAKLRRLRAEVGRIANAMEACAALPYDAWEPGALAVIARHLREAQGAAS